MTDLQIALEIPNQVIFLTQGVNIESRAPTDGITQAEADARYVRLPIGETVGRVSTVISSNQSGWREPTIPLASTNW